MNVVGLLYRISHKSYSLGVPFLPFLIKQLIRFIFGAVIPPQAQIGKNVHFAYNGLGIVIHHKCIIGNNVWICQQVTIGGKGEKGVPVIGDNVYLGAGAKILGEIKVGNNVKIGANAVVLNDIPDGCTAVGVPARIINKE